MNHQLGRTLQEQRTTLAPADVIAAAKRFFTRQLGIYSAFLEREGANHVVFRGQGGEEVVIGLREDRGATAVTGSSYLFDAQVARFLASLPPAGSPAVEEFASPDLKLAEGAQ